VVPGRPTVAQSGKEPVFQYVQQARLLEMRLKQAEPIQRQRTDD
jgi:hypothetical protein